VTNHQDLNMERDNLSDEIRNTFNKLRFLLSVDSVIEDVDLNMCNHFLNENKKIYNRLKRHEINLLSERGLTIPDIFTPSCEEKVQSDYLEWFHNTYPGVFIFALPNENMNVEFFKRMGGVGGIPDLFIPEFSLWVELKWDNYGQLSDKQKAIHKTLTGIGHTVITGYGFEDAKVKTSHIINPEFGYFKLIRGVINLHNTKLGGSIFDSDDEKTVDYNDILNELDTINAEFGYLELNQIRRSVLKNPDMYPNLSNALSNHDLTKKLVNTKISWLIRKTEKYDKVRPAVYKTRVITTITQADDRAILSPMV